MRRAAASLAALIVSLLLGQALAHAHLDASEPAHGGTASDVQAVTLRFTEPVEVAFSTFKLFDLDEALAILDVDTHDHGTGTEAHDHGEEAESHDHADDHDHASAAAFDPMLDAHAQYVVAVALSDATFSGGLVPAIADPARGAHAEVTLLLAQPLAPGTYVLAWRGLSVDTHASQGYLLFEVTE